MKRICLLVLVGLPAAGKTSFCHWLTNSSQPDFQIVHFPYDEFFDINQLIMPAATAVETVDAAYKAQRQRILELLEILLAALAKDEEIPNNIKNKINVSINKNQSDTYVILLDDNHYYRSMRYKIYQICKRRQLAFAQAYFECDLQSCLLRNGMRSTGCLLPKAVIEQMSARLEPPSNIHQWEALTLTIAKESSNIELNSVLNFDQTKVSLLHTLDNRLRRRIGELLLLNGGNSEKDKRDLAIKLNIQRKEILRNVKGSELIAERLNEFVDLLK